jgi:hypothetical protein
VPSGAVHTNNAHNLKAERSTTTHDQRPTRAPTGRSRLSRCAASRNRRHSHGRLLTPDDTVEFFNLVTGVKLSDQEKKDLVTFMLAL